MRPGDQSPRPARERADNHYASPAPPDHSRQERASGLNGPVNVDRHYPVKIRVQLGSSQLSSQGQTAALRTKPSTSPISPARRSIAARVLTSATKAAAFPPISRICAATFVSFADVDKKQLGGELRADFRGRRSDAVGGAGYQDASFGQIEGGAHYPRPPRRPHFFDRDCVA